MIKNLPTPFPMLEETEEMALNEWVWNSHYWIEYERGYWKCKWCGTFWTSTMPLTNKVKLCEKNPRLINNK